MTAALSLPGQPVHRVPRAGAAAAPADPTRRASRVRRVPTASIYRRRRAGFGLLVAGVVGSAGLLAGNVLTGPGGVPASAAGAGTAPAVWTAREVRVRAGDSLWSIAETYHGKVALTQYVEALISLNRGTHIEGGQVVRLP